MPGFRPLESFIRGLTSALPSNTRGRSPVPELGTPGSVRGVLSNGHPYRNPRPTLARFCRQWRRCARAATWPSHPQPSACCCKNVGLSIARRSIARRYGDPGGRWMPRDRIAIAPMDSPGSRGRRRPRYAAGRMWLLAHPSPGEVRPGTFGSERNQSGNSRSRHRLRNSSRLTRLYFPIDTVGM